MLGLYERAAKEANKAVLKEWTLDLFGQGSAKGGTLQHRQNRIECLIRLLKQIEALGHFLPVDTMARFPAWTQYFDGMQLRSLLVNSALGKQHADFMKHHQDNMKRILLR